MPRDTLVSGLDFPVSEAPDRCRRRPRQASERHFLLVWGPFGGFTRALASELRAAGARCSRVILNCGDVYDWGLDSGLKYRGFHADFGRWLAGIVSEHGVTDVVTYGDSHPYCADALEVARSLGLGTFVLEQGYFRPFWITLETGGVNGNSRLPRSPDAYLKAAESLQSVSDEWLPPLTPPAVWNLALHHAMLLLGASIFPRYRAPYTVSIVRQAAGHVRRYLDHRLFRSRHERWFTKVLSGEAPLYVVILQRPGDSQILQHSPYSSLEPFIDNVIESFAANAPCDSRLAFKSHPLDHGLERHGRVIARLARRHAVGDRVDFVDFGDLQAMLPRSAGAITLNSTAGLAAIEKGVPTIALGEAIYDMPGLTHQAGLEAFWTRAERPDAALYDAFRKVVIARTQVSGAYASREGVARAAPEVARRLLES